MQGVRWAWHLRTRAVVIGAMALYMCACAILGDVPVADAEEFEARDVIKRGTTELGLLAGYWQATDAISDVPSTNRSAIYFLPQAGVVLNDAFDAGYVSGSFTVLVEPVLAHYFEPFSASAFGGSLVLKYSFLSFGRWVPFWDFGAGMLWTDLAPRIREQSTQFNFIIETGPGVQYLFTKSIALTLGARLHHISNSGIGERNLGLNAGLFYGGVSFFIHD